MFARFIHLAVIRGANTGVFNGGVYLGWGWRRRHQKVMQIDGPRQVNTSLATGRRTTALSERYRVTRRAIAPREARRIYSPATNAHCRNSCVFNGAASSLRPPVIHAASTGRSDRVERPVRLDHNTTP